MGALTPPACGAIVNLRFGWYLDKGQGEITLLRRLRDVLIPGDLLLRDRLLGNWQVIVMLQQRGLELVTVSPRLTRNMTPNTTIGSTGEARN